MDLSCDIEDRQVKKQRGKAQRGCNFEKNSESGSKNVEVDRKYEPYERRETSTRAHQLKEELEMKKQAFCEFDGLNGIRRSRNIKSMKLSDAKVVSLD